MGNYYLIKSNLLYLAGLIYKSAHSLIRNMKGNNGLQYLQDSNTSCPSSLGNRSISLLSLSFQAFKNVCGGVSQISNPAYKHILEYAFIINKYRKLLVPFITRERKQLTTVPTFQVNVDFEGFPATDADFHGIKRLLLQCFRGLEVNASGLTDTIISQNYVGSVIKVWQ